MLRVREVVVVHFCHLETIHQKVQVAQDLLLCEEPGWHYGVGCRAVVHKQHPLIGLLWMRYGVS